MEPNKRLGRPFLWGWGQPLADALAAASLTLDDGPFFPIRLVPLAPGGGHPGVDPVYERDRQLLAR